MPPGGHYSAELGRIFPGRLGPPAHDRTEEMEEVPDEGRFAQRRMDVVLGAVRSYREDRMDGEDLDDLTLGVPCYGDLMERTQRFVDGSFHPSEYREMKAACIQNEKDAATKRANRYARYRVRQGESASRDSAGGNAEPDDDEDIENVIDH